MTGLRLVVVGGVAGGASAAARARRLSEDAEITVFERGPYISFANCGLPYFVGGEIVQQDSLLVQTPQSLQARFNLNVRVNTEVVGVNREAKCVAVRELETGREYEQAYDAVILSTGASPIKPPLPGIDRDGHFTVRNIPVAAFASPTPTEKARASTVVLKSGKRIPADLVVLGLGVRPEVSLARQAGLETGALGGIRVNQHLQTSDPHIWAVGDAIEVRDQITGGWSLVPLAGPANRQGRIAADNVFGRRSTYEGTWGTAILRLFGLTAGCTGANEKTLRKAGIPYQAIHLHPNSHAGYYPGAEPIALKIVFAPGSGKLLGGQAVGREGVDKRIDVLAAALKGGMTVHDLAELELAYAPPYGSAKDPLNLAGMAASNVLAGDVKLAQWHEIPLINPETTILLDVRNPEERAKGHIPGSIHIPLPQLRARAGELPKGKEIVVHCESGQRSYYACRILAQRGFRARNLTGSYRTWKTATMSDRAAT